jgi:hypothetical protein
LEEAVNHLKASVKLKKILEVPEKDMQEIKGTGYF